MKACFGGSEFEMSLADILGFENESDLFNRQPKVSIRLYAASLLCAPLHLQSKLSISSRKPTH